MRSNAVRFAIMLVLAAALGLPAAPASAHGRLPTGKYPCYFYGVNGWEYSYFDLIIKSRRRYAFKLGDDTVGRAGRFRHPSDSQRIRFRSGYLANQGFKGQHRRSDGDHTVRLRTEVAGEPFYYYCSD